MAIKVEDVPVGLVRQYSYKEFLVALRSLEVGQSFEYPNLTTNHRQAMGVCAFLLERQYLTRKVDGAVRVGRVL